MYLGGSVQVPPPPERHPFTIPSLMQKSRTLFTYLRPNLTTAPRVRMPSFTLPDDESVTVTLPESGVILKDDLLDFGPFQTWLKALQKNLALQKSNPKHAFNALPYELKNIDVQAADWFGERLGFVKFTAEVENEDVENIPGSVFLRGPSVAMMVILQPDDVAEGSQDEKHVLLTIQPRIPAASLAFVELPAGMVDDSGTFAGAAAREIKEELGLTIPEAELTNLTELALSPTNRTTSASSTDTNGDTTTTEESLPSALFPSPGGCDEHISIFLHEKRVPRAQLKEWTGKLTGLRDEGEKITLKLVRLEDLWWEGARDGKTVAAWGLYMGLRGVGRI